MSAPVQSPLLRIPAKSTDEVDLASAVSHLIVNSYGQEPKEFAEQLSVLNRARQDAIRGAGSDTTGRDLLYKWFHMLEMLELRFPELRAPFPWKDAFTQKAITQHSLAYEKASIIFNIASVLSSIGARTHRIGSAPSTACVIAASSGATSPAPKSSAAATSSAPAASAATGTKLAYTALRQAAGMLTYINENFLHAPSTDMSKDVVRWLIDMQLAQATEVFWERTLEEKKGGNLVARIASQAAVLYANLAEESKEWVGRSVFDRSWGLLVQTKAKYFASVAQYYRALIDEAASEHGKCLVRLTLSETLAKEAQKLCVTFAASAGSSSSSTSATGSLPSDSASSLRIILENHLGIVSARKTQAVKDNDLIYHDILPTESTLPVIEPMTVAQPITIQDIYASPEVQKITGASGTGVPTNDLFSALVPLGVHEAASMYSEEKAKLVRSESERTEMANAQLEASLESMSLPKSLKKFKPDGLQDLLDPGSEVVGWAEEEIEGGGSRGEDGLGTGSDAIDVGLRRVYGLRDQARQDLDESSRLLDEETALCEKLRVRFGDKWSQSPSGLEAKAIRSDLKSNRAALQQAMDNDGAIEGLWRQSEPLIRVLLGGRESLEAAFAEALTGSSGNGDQLVDLLQDDTASDAELEKLRSTVATIEGHLAALHRIKKDRTDALTELRSQIQTDDISHILILNRRATNDSQTALFKQELEKFRPLTQRIVRSVTEQERVIDEITRSWKEINEGSSTGRTRVQEWQKKNAARERLIENLRRAKDSNAQVRAGLAKGLTFYTQLQEIASSLRRNARSFVEERGIERERLKGELESQESSRGSLNGNTSGIGHYGAAPAPAAPSHSYDGLESAFDRMGVNEGQHAPSRGYSGYSSTGPVSPVYQQPQQPFDAHTYGRSSVSPPPAAPQRQHTSPYENIDAAFAPTQSFSSVNAGQQPPPSHYASPAPPAGPTHYAQPSYSSGGPYSGAPHAPQPQASGYGSSSYGSVAPTPAAQRQPSLPPPPPQFKSSYGGGGAGGPPPAALPTAGSGAYGQQPPAGYGQPAYAPSSGHPYAGGPPSSSARGPPPPPLPYQQSYAYGNQKPPPPPPGQQAGGYGASPAAYPYGAPPPPASPYGQPQQQQPPPQQPQRWHQPPY